MKSPRVSSPRSPRANARSPRAVTRGRLFDRHSGTGLRGTPKRNGAGAKGAWGTIMDQDGPAYVDRNDPNYDSEEEGDFVLEELTLARPPPAPPAAAPPAAAAPAGVAPAEPASADTASSSGDSHENPPEKDAPVPKQP